MKGRYALAALTHMAARFGDGEHITVISISEALGISKIYLEQVFALLKRGGLVTSIKGAQGGYRLAHPPHRITVFSALAAVETSLFEEPETTVPEKAPDIDAALRTVVFDALSESIHASLEKITLEHLLAETERYTADGGNMFYI